MTTEQLLLALARCSFLTCREKVLLSEKLDNSEELTVLSIEDLCVLAGRRLRMRQWKPELLLDLVERDLRCMQRFAVSWTTVLHDRFPPLLRELYDPPFLLFWRGVLPDPEKPMVGIVGTRSPSGNGALAAARFAGDLAKQGVPVVSGLARGIDAFAHRGSLEGGERTTAVMACGPDQIYPRSNARLAGRILETGGCLLSEYPPGEAPLAFRFPQRNRIISALARTVLVVEAPQKSGALITADYALEQGRDVVVCAECLSSEKGEGIRGLHTQGARAVESASEIVEDWCLPGCITVTGQEAKTSIDKSGVTGAGRQLALEFERNLVLFEQRQGL